MKDSRKLKKKPKKFKFKKHQQPPQGEKLKASNKIQQEDLKKSLPYNRSFIKNFILNKKEKIEQEKNKNEQSKQNQPESKLGEKVKSFFSKFQKNQAKKEITKEKTEETTKNQPSIIEQKNSYWNNTLSIYKRIEKDLLLTLITIILILILALLNLMNNRVIGQIAQNRLSDIDYQVTVHPYPIVVSPINPNMSAQSAIVMDKDSQVILYAKNPTVKFSMASTTKLMTALVGLDYYHPDSILTIKTPHVEGSNLGFYAGEQFTFQDLLYAMMLPSSNEAAYAVAENYPVGKAAFIEKMNDKAKQLHLQNTNYGDPAGLDDDQNFSTVVDLARLASIDLENPLLAHIVATKEHILIDRSGRQLPIHSLNQLLGIDGINGVKTGTTEAAGEVLITSTVQNNHTYIIVVMRSDQRFVDTINLVHSLTNNVNYIQPQFAVQ
jgi:D-alanyl-D-alanine carboxypeptidase (penicillin-binding protein 5/6)